MVENLLIDMRKLLCQQGSQRKLTFCRRAQNEGKIAAAFEATRKIDCHMCPRINEVTHIK